MITCISCGDTAKVTFHKMPLCDDCAIVALFLQQFGTENTPKFAREKK